MIELCTLGTAVVRQAGHHRTLQPKDVALLAYLVAARPRGPQRREILVSLLWPETGERRARNALNQALHRIRKALGPGVVLSRGYEEVGIDPNRTTCDAVTFEQELDAGRFAEALERYTGEFLAGLYVPGAIGFERWLDSERSRLTRRARDAARALAEREAAHGNDVAAVRWLERGLEISPSDETDVRRLIALLDRLGDRSGALSAYDLLRKHLETQFGASPSPETEELVASVRRRGPQREPGTEAPRRSAWLRSLGEPASPGPEAVQLGTRPPGVASEAYDEFLRGVVAFPETTPNAFDDVLRHFERAVEIEPDFAEAHAWIAFQWANAAYTGARALPEARERALPAAERALRLAPELGSIHAIHATVLMAFVRDWPAVDASFAKALELGGGEMRSYAAYPLFVTGMRRFDQALALAKEGIHLNPNGVPHQFLLGWVQYRSRRYEEAIEQLSRTLAHWPTYPWTGALLAASQLFAGWPSRAVQTCRRMLTGAPIPTATAIIAATLARAGAGLEARTQIDALLEIDRSTFVDPYLLAVAHAGSGDIDATFGALDRLVEQGSAHTWCIPVEVFLDPIRSDRRFRRIVERLALPALS
jgi:DNA-binding SARP family transcriptional activator/Tfp pilus assembly protein PilF